MRGRARRHRAAALRRQRRPRPLARAAGEVARDRSSAMRHRRRHRRRGAAPRRRDGAARASPPTRSTCYVHELCIERGAYPEPAQLQPLPQERVHVGERGHLPRHPRHPRAAGRRHRQPRRHHLHRRGARRHQRHVPRRRRRPREPPSSCGSPRSACGRASRRCTPGRPVSDIGRAIEDHARKHHYGVVRAFIGHGIGEQFHTDLQILHYYDERASDIMRPGMTFTIEPMITLGLVAPRDVARRVDGGDLRRPAHGAVRAHAARHRRRRRRADRRRRRRLAREAPMGADRRRREAGSFATEPTTAPC